MTKADNASAGLFGWARVGGGTDDPYEADTRPGALWRTLRSDPVALAAMAVIVALAGLAAVALFVAALEPLARSAAFVRPAIALVALTAGTSRLAHGWERRLWAKIAGAVVLWGLAWAVLAMEEPRAVTSAVAAGALFAAAFVTLLSAIEGPHRHRGWSGSAVFAVGLFFYFVVMTAAVDPVADAVDRQLFYMLLILDFYTVTKLIYFGGAARATRWRMLYSLLMLAMAGVFLNDVIACLRVAGVVPHSAGDYGLGWSVPLVFLVLAARLRHHPVASEEPESGDARWPREHPVAFALAFPLIHLSFYGGGLLGTAEEPVRNAFVLVWVLVFGTIAFGRQRQLESQLRRLELERPRAEDAAQRDEERRRRDEERRDARPVLRISEEKLNQAWRSIPDAMLISTVADGRILEVNDGFLRHFGYERDEVLGKTGVELKLWVEPEDRAMMTRLLRERGVVRNLAFELTPRSGEKRLALLSGEIVDLEGTTCFVMVLRDVTEFESFGFTDQ